MRMQSQDVWLLLRRMLRPRAVLCSCSAFCRGCARAVELPARPRRCQRERSSPPPADSAWHCWPPLWWAGKLGPWKAPTCCAARRSPRTRCASCLQALSSPQRHARACGPDRAPPQCEGDSDKARICTFRDVEREPVLPLRSGRDRSATLRRVADHVEFHMIRRPDASLLTQTALNVTVTSRELLSAALRRVRAPSPGTASTAPPTTTTWSPSTRPPCTGCVAWACACATQSPLRRALEPHACVVNTSMTRDSLATAGCSVDIHRPQAAVTTARRASGVCVPRPSAARSLSGLARIAAARADRAEGHWSRGP